MERGDLSIAAAVLIVLSIVGTLSATTLFMHITGQVAQGQPIYVTQNPSTVGLMCRQDAYFLGYQGNYALYCCMEEMSGQNECRNIHKIFIT